VLPRCGKPSEGTRRKRSESPPAPGLLDGDSEAEPVFRIIKRGPLRSLSRSVRLSLPCQAGEFIPSAATSSDRWRRPCAAPPASSLSLGLADTILLGVLQR